MKKGKKLSLSNESIRQIVGIPLDAEELKPPPEYYQLKKEVRAKQTEVRNLRKRWWSDHKDLEVLAEKVRVQVQAERHDDADLEDMLDPMHHGARDGHEHVDLADVPRRQTIRKSLTGQLAGGQWEKRGSMGPGAMAGLGLETDGTRKHWRGPYSRRSDAS